MQRANKERFSLLLYFYYNLISPPGFLKKVIELGFGSCSLKIKLFFKDFPKKTQIL
jgi:hypothetical protein